MKKLLVVVAVFSSLANCFADDYKWSCRVQDNKYGTIHEKMGPSKRIAKKKAYEKCLDFSLSGVCKFRGCSKNS